MNDLFNSTVDEAGLGERIRQVVDLCPSKGQAAVIAGVSSLSMRRYIAGEQAPAFATLARLAQAVGVSLEWLATGQGEMRTSAPGFLYQGLRDTLGRSVDGSEFVFIPRYDLNAAAGHGASVDDEKPMFTMAFRRYWVEQVLHVSAADLSVIAVKGDSMEGVLNDRDVILINHAQKTGDGMFVLRISGDLVVKRLQRLPGNRVRVTSANEAYEPFEISLDSTEQDIALIGKVIWFGRVIG